MFDSLMKLAEQATARIGNGLMHSEDPPGPGRLSRRSFLRGALKVSASVAVIAGLPSIGLAAEKCETLSFGGFSATGSGPSKKEAHDAAILAAQQHANTNCGSGDCSSGQRPKCVHKELVYLGCTKPTFSNGQWTVTRNYGAHGCRCNPA